MTKMTTSGQVTIAKRLCDHLGLEPGSVVDFAPAEDGPVLLKVDHEAPESRFARLRGSAKLGITTNEPMALTRARTCADPCAGWSHIGDPLCDAR
jgi:antitoxin PrlF